MIDYDELLAYTIAFKRDYLPQKESKKSTVFENLPKSRIQHCERSELRIHFEWTKVDWKCQKCSFLASFEYLKLAVKQFYQTADRSLWIVQKLVENSNETIYYPIRIDLSGNSIWPQALGFQKSPKLTILDIFDELLSTQNVNLIRNVEWDFSAIFKHCA